MTGWECPKCGACYSPSVARCMNCTGQVTTTGYWMPTSVYVDQCPVCKQSRNSAPQTGCPANEHYSATLTFTCDDYADNKPS